MATPDTPTGPGGAGPDTPDDLYGLFHAAVGLRPEDRAAFLEDRCGPDTRLRAELEALLAHDRRADRSGFLGHLLGEGRGPAHPARDGAGRPLVGRRLGPYRVLGLVARGGMGAVYRAARVDDYAQVVAVKVVRPELLSESALLRFRSERQALAGLAHPHIARLLDGGTTPDGVPYAVQEFVDGERIDRHAAGRGRGPRDRLRLLLAAGRAVEHAHRNGVIHRDLKPSNILVDRAGQVKVVDFGLARSLGPEAPDLTATGEVLGTVAYMSPERLAGPGGRGDTRSDVYALGVVGYELLAGRPPIDVSGLGLGAAARVVCETEPARLGAIDRAFRGDLDAVFRRALATDPDHRYPSAGAFADDLDRYLRGEPVTARPPSLAASARRFVRRHRAAVAAGTVALVSLVAALVGVSAALIHARQKEAEAVAAGGRAEESRRQARRAVDDMYTWVGARLLAREPGMSQQRREFLEKALAHYQQFAREGGADPEVRFKTAQAHFHVAAIQNLLGRHAEAERAFRAQIALLRQLAADAPAEPEYRFDLFHAHKGLAGAVMCQERDAEATAIDRAALAMIEALAADVPGEPNYRDAVANQNISVAQHLADHGRAGEAERLARRALDVAGGLVRAFPARRAMPCYTLNVARALRLLGRVRTASGQLADAAAAYEDAARAGQEAVDLHPDDPALVLELVEHQLHLARARARLGRLGPAEEELLARAARAQDQLAHDFPDLPGYVSTAADAHRDLAYHFLATGQEGRAAEPFGRYVSIQEGLARRLPDDLDRKEKLAWYLAIVPAPLGDPARALQLVGEVRRRRGDPTRCARTVGAARYRQGDWPGCIAAMTEPPLEGGRWGVVPAYFLAMSWQALGDPGQARAWYDRAARWASEGYDQELRQVRAEVERRLGKVASAPR